MKIKELKELDGETNSIYRLWYNLNDSIAVINVIYAATMVTIESLKEVDKLKLYGFDVDVLQKADISVLQAIQEEFGFVISMIRGKWYYTVDNKIYSLDGKLKEAGYYL